MFITSLTGADDLVLMSLDSSGLQNCITALHDYCTKWGLDVSITRARCVISLNGHTRYELQQSLHIWTSSPSISDVLYILRCTDYAELQV